MSVIGFLITDQYDRRKVNLYLMKNITIFGLCFLIIKASTGCSEKAHNPKSISDDKAPNRITLIDVSFSAWYAEQMGAASQIEYILDIKFGSINNARDPDDILDEQRRYIDEVKMGSFPDKEEFDDALRRWHEHQINAANCLRSALTKTQIVADSKQDSKFILDLQHRDVVALKSELVKLGHEHWKDGEFKSGAPTNGIDRANPAKK